MYFFDFNNDTSKSFHGLETENKNFMVHCFEMIVFSVKCNQPVKRLAYNICKNTFCYNAR